MKRGDGRNTDELRPISFEIDYVAWPEGSVLVSTGKTRVLCNVTVENDVPAWMKARPEAESGGWVTAEYSMLPRSTHTRTKRADASTGSRAQEIKRLVGRALRGAVDLKLLGRRTCIVDCDVLQADGGTRTASITGGFVALSLALSRLAKKGDIPAAVITAPVAAVSAGIVGGTALLDLCYSEDSSAEVDAHFVMDGRGRIIEVQGTAEKDPFSKEQFLCMLDMAQKGIQQLISLQQEALAPLLKCY